MGAECIVRDLLRHTAELISIAMSYDRPHERSRVAHRAEPRPALPLEHHTVNKAALTLLGAAAALAAGAGTHAAADSGFHGRPASARSLPADNLPPFGMLDDADGSHVFVAMRKALTALAFQMPSSTAQQRVPLDAARPRRTGLLEMHERLRPAQQVALRVVDAE